MGNRILRSGATLAAAAFALVVLAAGGRLVGDEPKAEPSAHRHDRLDAMAAKLGLSDEQKDQIRKVHADYDQKLADAEHQLWTLHHEEREAMSKVLTDEQRQAAGRPEGVPRQGIRGARGQDRPDGRTEKETGGSPRGK